jgi:hypothetical protein
VAPLRKQAANGEHEHHPVSRGVSSLLEYSAANQPKRQRTAKTDPKPSFEASMLEWLLSLQQWTNDRILLSRNSLLLHENYQLDHVTMDIISAEGIPLLCDHETFPSATRPMFPLSTQLPFLNCPRPYIRWNSFNMMQ